MENKNMNLGILKTKSIKSTIKDAIIRIIVKDVLPDDIQDKFKNIKLLYLDSGIIAYGDRGMISSSTDLTRWRHSTIGIENLNDAILFKNVFIIIGDNGTILYSENAYDWEILLYDTKYNFIKLEINNGILEAHANNGFILKSENGYFWN